MANENPVNNGNYAERVRNLRKLLNEAYDELDYIGDYAGSKGHHYRVWGLAQAQQDLGNLNTHINAILDPEGDPYKS